MATFGRDSMMRARWRLWRQSIAWHDLVRASALLSLPAAVVLAVLVAATGVGLQAALIGLAVTFVGMAGLIAPHFRDLKRTRDYVERLRARHEAATDIPDPPRIRSMGLDRRLPEAIAESARAREAHRRELDAAIRGNEAVLSNLPDPLFLLDETGAVRRANRAATVQFGEAIAGRALATVIRHPDLLQAADAVIAGGGQEEVEFTTPGEVERVFSARIAPITGPTADGTVAVISLHDVTAIRRAEQMRADFVANASHELRTPLSSLLGFIETLQGPAKDDPDARERFMGIMLEQARRMSNLVEDLLSLSRIELDEHSPPQGEADLAGIADSVARSLELRAKQRDMRIELELDADTLPVLGDADQLTQVVQNLVDNAIKYGRGGTPIRIIARSAENGQASPRPSRRGVALSVVDQGEGIPREHVPRLTERFYRVDKARSRELGGTGLGLAIVKHIVNRHRGELEVDSTVGEGTRFTVYLPSAPKQAQAEPAARAAAS